MKKISDPNAGANSELSISSSYGNGDTSFQAAGGEDGVFKLVNCFYDVMQSHPKAKTIKDMHHQDLSVSRDKLARFLCAWLGGPKLFSQKYGTIRIPHAHSHLAIGPKERDAWLFCMEEALKEQNYSQDFKEYLMKQLYVPAERSRNQD